MTAAFLAETGEDRDTSLLSDLKDVIRQQYAATARHLQTTLGPSEIGHPCPRKLATALTVGAKLETPINPEGDPLPSWVGTAGHSRLELAIELDNNRIIDERAAYEAEHGDRGGPRCTFLGEITNDGDPMAIGRWFTERRVTIRPGLSGTCDLYDTWTDTVIDAKFPGTTAFQGYLKSVQAGRVPNVQYQVQAHAYGRGYRNEGFDVKRVAIWFLPRGGQLSKSFLWSEPYNDEIVDAALAKLDNIALLLDEFDVTADHLERLALFPRKPHNCPYCPVFTPQKGHPNPIACNGGAA